MPEEISFGKWLRQHRRTLDLTQQTLADQVGCARITLRRIEADALKPSKELALILLEKLGIPESERPPWLLFARGLVGFPTKPDDSAETQRLTNLPASLTSFIGRAKEQTDIIRLISKHRLVTLTGSGGVGKTRLSLKVGEQLLEDYPNGIWLVELASLSDSTLLPQTIAALFDITTQSNMPITELLSNFLRAKSLLIILDNCEHLLDACAHLADTLLKNCPNLKILATSREALGITGEAAYPVPSLGLPDLEQLLENFRKYESVRLFEERAQLAKMDFSLMLENASSVAQICHRLDGIPLAIELAAAHVNIFSTEQIAAQLNESFNLLTGGSRTVLPRHQTIRASIDWSWNLLTDSERILLMRLSVFAGSWALDSAESICSGNGIESHQVLELMGQLVKKSLVVVKQEAGRETRYHFHEMVREFAHEKLVEAGESDALCDKNLEYFLELAETAAPHLLKPEQLEWLAQLEMEHNNLRTALEWSLGKIQSEYALRLAAALGMFWNMHCYWTEGSKWLANALAKPTENLNPAGKTARVRALYHDVALADSTDDMERMKISAEACLALCETGTDRRDLAIAQLYLGEYLVRQGQYAQAQPLIEQSLAEFQILNDSYWEAQAYDEICLIDVHQGTLDFFERVKQNVEMARKSGERLTIISALSEYIFQLYVHDRTDEAINYASEVEMLFQEIGFNSGSTTTMLFAEIAWLTGDNTKARSLFTEEQERLGVIGEKNLQSGVIASLGLLSMEEGKLSEAQTYIEQSLAMATEIGNKMFIVYRLSELGNVFYLQGNTERCKQNFRQSFSLAKDLTNPQKALPLMSFLNTLYKRKPERTAKILGSIDRYRNEHNDPGSPLRKRYYNLAEKYSREALGSSAFNSAFMAGRVLSLDDALDLALKTVEGM